MAEEEKKAKKKRPTAQKRDIQNLKKFRANHAVKSAMRTGIRAFKEALPTKDADKIQEELKSVYSLLDRGVKKGVISANKASRDKSRFALKAKA